MYSFKQFAARPIRMTGVVRPSKVPVYKPLPAPPQPAGGLIREVERRIISQVDVSGGRQALISKRNPNRLRPGAVVSVESYSFPTRSQEQKKTDLTSRSSYTTSGFVMQIKRRGVYSTLRIRTLIDGRYGVETTVPIFSPRTKKITVLNEQGLKRPPRQQRLWFLRKSEIDTSTNRFKSVSRVIE